MTANSTLTPPVAEPAIGRSHGLRYRIQAVLHQAQAAVPADRVGLVRHHLYSIQMQCQSLGKTFIVVEEAITCDQFGLGGQGSDRATLFRGPLANASVAICVTQRGSLLHRDGNSWHVYCDLGDFNCSD